MRKSVHPLDVACGDLFYSYGYKSWAKVLDIKNVEHRSGRTLQIKMEFTGTEGQTATQNFDPTGDSFLVTW